MNSKIYIASLIFAASAAVAERNPKDVRVFAFFPAQKCKPDPSVPNLDLCKDLTKGSELCDGGETFCPGALCGPWGGNTTLCCNGTPDQTFKFNPTDVITACKAYADKLKDIDTSKGSDPITKGCDDSSKYYPTGLTAGSSLDLLRGNKTKADVSCCSLDKDSLNVYSDLTTTLVSSKCIDPLGGSSSSSSSSGGDSTSSGSSSSASSSSSSSGGDSKGNMGSSVTPSISGLITSFFVATLAGVVGMGML